MQPSQDLSAEAQRLRISGMMSLQQEDRRKDRRVWTHAHVCRQRVDDDRTQPMAGRDGRAASG